MSNSFFDQEDVEEQVATKTSSFFDQEDTEDQESVPMGGEMGLSDVVADADASIQEPAPAPEVSQGKAALLGAQQGATMGFSDEIGAGMQVGMEGAHKGARGLQDLYNRYLAAKTPLPEVDMISQPATEVNEELASSGASGDLGPTSTDEVYDEEVAAQRNELQAAEDQNPWTYGAADVAGSFAIPVPGAAAARGAAKVAPKAMKAAQGLSKAKKGIAAGAAVGAAEAAGRTEESLLSPGGITDVAVGGATGGALGGILGKMSKNAEPDELLKKADSLYKESNLKTAASMGARPSDMAKILGTKTNKSASVDTAKEVGRTLMEEDIFKVSQSADELKTAIVNKMDDVAENRMAPAAQKIDELTADPSIVFTEEMAEFSSKTQTHLDEITDAAKYAKGSDKNLYKSMEETSVKVMEDIDNAMNGSNKATDLIDIKRRIQKQVNWDDPTGNAYNEYLVRLQRDIDGMVRGIAEKASPEDAAALIDANKVYSNLTMANKIAGDELARDAVQTGGIGWKDYFLGGAVSGISNSPMLGAAAVAAKRTAEHVTGKDAGKLAQGMEALHKFKKARGLEKQAETAVSKFDNMGPIRQEIAGYMSGTGGVASKVAASSAVAGTVSSDKKIIEPYQMHQKSAKIIEKATPEMLTEQAQVIREEYGQEGERLAGILEKMSEKDQRARRALMFTILQNPQYKNMLMPKAEEK